MKRMLVLQLARFGDLVQTRRLLATLTRDVRPLGGEVHLVVDTSLLGLARRLYPRSRSTGWPSTANRTTPPRPRPGRYLPSWPACVSEAIYCLNFSPLAMAVAAMFPPEIQRGYRLHAGQPDKDALLRLVFRLARDRRGAGINLADIWAHLADRPVAARTVNPPAVAGDGGVGAGPGRPGGPPVAAPGDPGPGGAHAFSGHGRPAGAAFRHGRAGSGRQGPAAPARSGRAGACRNLTGQTDLPGLIDALTGLSVLVTPDTGVMHLAAALGVPVMAFFLSSAWCHETGPYGAGHRVWQAVTECAPCLEAAPCPNALACLAPLADPGLCRLVAGSTKAAVPSGLVGYVTDCDALGTLCRPVAGEDPTVGSRTAVRALVARRLGIDLPLAADLSPALVQALTVESDWMLPPPGRPAAGEW